MRKFPRKLLEVIEDLHTDTTCSVRAFGKISAPFSIKTGFKQGCVLAPFCFNLYIDSVARHILQNLLAGGVQLAYRIEKTIRVLDCASQPTLDMVVWILMYADDIVLMSDDVLELNRAMHITIGVCKRWGMEVSAKKSKCMLVADLNREVGYDQLKDN